MKVEVEANVIAEIRNALTIIQLNAERRYVRNEDAAKEIVKQVKRIDKLLPQVAFEEDCPICHGQGATTDHHDPCTECGGSGKVGGEG